MKYAILETNQWPLSSIPQHEPKLVLWYFNILP